MDYSIRKFRLMLIDCIEGVIESRKLGEFAYDAWFHYTDDENKDKTQDKVYIDFLLEISSEWGFIRETMDVQKFGKEYLQNLLNRLEHFMNVENQEPGF